MQGRCEDLPLHSLHIWRPKGANDSSTTTQKEVPCIHRTTIFVVLIPKRILTFDQLTGTLAWRPKPWRGGDWAGTYTTFSIRTKRLRVETWPFCTVLRTLEVLVNIICWSFDWPNLYGTCLRIENWNERYQKELGNLRAFLERKTVLPLCICWRICICILACAQFWLLVGRNFEIDFIQLMRKMAMRCKEEIRKIWRNQNGRNS